MPRTKRLFCLLVVFSTTMTPLLANAEEARLVPEPTSSEAVRVLGSEGEEIVSQPVVVATTDIYDATIVTQNEHDITVLFNLHNTVGVQSGVVYGVELYSRGPSGQRLVDVSVMSAGPITLGADETLPVSFTYSAPKFLSGKYEVWVVARSQGGMLLSLNQVGSVLLSGVSPYIDLTNCFAQVAGKSFSPSFGVDLSPEETMKVSCTAENYSAEAMKITPRFTSYDRSVYGAIVPTEVTNVQSTVVAPNEKTEVIFSVPTAIRAQAYDTVLELVNETGKVVSPKVLFHYVIQGGSATIQNVVFDKRAYTAGDEAEVMIAWSLAADSFRGARGAGTELGTLSLSVAMADASGNFCSSPTMIDLQQTNLVSKITVPVSRNCVAPQVIVGISDEQGTKLSGQSYEFAAVAVAEELKAPATEWSVLMSFSGLLAIIVLLLLVAVRLLSFVMGRRMPAITRVYEPAEVSRPDLRNFIILFLVSGSVFLGVQVSSVAAVTLNVASGFDTVTFTVNTNKSTYEVGEQVEVFGAAFVTGCGNSLAAGGLEAEDGQGVTQTIGTFTVSSGSGFGMFDRYITGYSTPGNKVMPIRAYVTTGTVTNSALGNLPLSVVCPSGSSWNGSTCVGALPIPTATISGDGCSIAAGQSTCVTPISWNIQNAPDPIVRNVTTNTIYSYQANGTNEYRTIQYGVNTIAAYNGASTLASTAVVGSCQIGSSWNGSLCENTNVITPSAIISGTACEIEVGQSSCTIEVDWNIQTATTPNVYNETIGISYASVPTGNDVPFTVSRGSYSILARDGIFELARTTVLAECKSGLAWDGSACVASGIGLNFTANGDEDSVTIMKGDDVVLKWVTSGLLTSCTASDDWTGAKDIAGGSETRTNIMTDSLFTLICTGPGGSVSETVVISTVDKANLLPVGLSLSPSTNFDLVTGVYEFLYVQYSIHNNGGIAAGAFTNQLRLDRSNDGSFEESENDSVTGLLAGADTPLAPILLAANVPFGTHRVYLKTDVLGDVAEEDEGDNEDSFVITVPVPDPKLELTANPVLLRNGQSTTLTWNTNATFSMDCILQGPKITYGFNPISTGATGSRVAGPITAKSEFVLQCTEPMTGTIFTDSAWVEVIPTTEEI